jgi:hypothetical protein
VSSSETWSPLVSDTVHSSSSAAIVEFGDLDQGVLELVQVSPSSAAISSSVGARWSGARA